MSEKEMQEVIKQIKDIKTMIGKRNADDVIEDGIAELARMIIHQDFADEPSDLMTIISFMIGY
jgi:hypothetical protein